MDTDNVERVELNTLGRGGSAADAITVTGTNGKDHNRVSGSNGNVRVSGLSTDVRLSDAEPTDQLTINTLTGNDKVATGRLAKNVIGLSIL